jgi:hypothetical protein
MSITLRLDTTGLRKMIEDNPEFKIEIQKGVLDNINSDNIEQAVRTKIEIVLRSMCKEEGNYYNKKYTITDAKLIEAMRLIVEQQVVELSETAIKNNIADIISGIALELRRDMKANLKASILEVMTPELAKEILIAKLV